MKNPKCIRNYAEVIRFYQELKQQVSSLIYYSEVKPHEVWTLLSFKKDTYYRRLKQHDWTTEELSLLLPFLLKKIQTVNPKIYEHIMSHSSYS